MPKFAGLLSRVGDYFAALGAYRQGDADQIVDLFAASALEALAQAGIVTAAQLDKRTRAYSPATSSASIAWSTLMPTAAPAPIACGT